MAANGNDIALGSPAAPFRLPEPSTGKTVALDDFKDAKAVLVAFYSNRCPFVVHIRESFNDLARDYAQRGLAVIAINANDVETHPLESAEKIAEEVAEHGLVFHYLRDDSQDIARAYEAACTPDLFLYDQERKLFYHGQFDDSRPKGEEAATGRDLRAAVDRLLSGQSAPAEQKSAIGCGIKWKAGQEPAWHAAA
jgi:peroxiredoxin